MQKKKMEISTQAIKNYKTKKQCLTILNKAILEIK